MARSRSLSQFKAQFEAAQKDLEEARRKEATRIGMIALDAGFDNFELDDKTLKAAFTETAARFQKGSQTPPSSPAAGET